MVEAVAYSDVTRAPPKVDAWALLVDAASGRKGPKNIKAPPPPEGFVNIVDYGPSGERGSRLRAGVLNAEMAQLSERLWGELRGELGYLKETDLADVRLALEISLYAHRGQVRERMRSACVRGVDQLRGCSRATCLTGHHAVDFRGTQVRRSGEPFIEHPVEVAKILGRFRRPRMLWWAEAQVIESGNRVENEDCCGGLAVLSIKNRRAIVDGKLPFVDD